MVDRDRQYKLFTRKNIIVMLLFIAAIFMAIGYAAYTIELKINAVGKIYNDRDIIFTNIELKDKTDKAEYIIPTPAITMNGLELTFYVELTYPDDYVIFDVTVENFSETWDELLVQVRDTIDPLTDFILYDVDFYPGTIVYLGFDHTFTVKAYWNPAFATETPSDAIKKEHETPEHQTHTERQTIIFTFNTIHP